MNRRKQKRNIVIADYGKSKDNSFLEGLRTSTGEEWILLSWENNGLRKNKLSNLERYFGYFIHPFGIFLKRGGITTL